MEKTSLDGDVGPSNKRENTGIISRQKRERGMQHLPIANNDSAWIVVDRKAIATSGNSSQLGVLEAPRTILLHLGRQPVPLPSFGVESSMPRNWVCPQSTHRRVLASSLFVLWAGEVRVLRFPGFCAYHTTS
uniref:Uncharacterized protein n=1 Tax=Anopheles coluzzii TaxID=1518534 RepID=A0A8W7PYQ4_ANOCL